MIVQILTTLVNDIYTNKAFNLEIDGFQVEDFDTIMFLSLKFKHMF